MGTVDVTTGVSKKTGKPAVMFRVEKDEFLGFGVALVAEFDMSPDEAREFARNIQEAATIAVYDGALTRVITEMFPEDAETLLSKIRESRDDRWGRDG